MKNRKILVAGILFLFLGSGLLSACASGAKTPPAATGQPEATSSAGMTIPTEAPAVSEPIRVVDGLGRELTLVEPAARIVSLAPSNTEILYAIGAGDQVVARDEFSDTPAEVLELPSIGGGWGDINIEVLLTLEPDLVLAADIVTREKVDQLEALGLTVFMVPNPQVLDDVFVNLVDVGVLTGHKDEAQALAASLRSRVEAVAAALEGVEPLRAYYEVDGTDATSPWTTGSGTFQDVLISMAGGENIAAAMQGWGQISLEEIIAQDPQVMVYAAGPFVPTTVESVMERVGWENISAVSEGKVFPIDTNWIDRPGTPRLVDALEALAKMFHPERFE